MNYPNNLKYTEDHEWISTPIEGIASVGVTAYAIEQLTDIVHVDFPEVGDKFEAGEAFGTIESTKTVSDLYLPLGGEVVAINEDILDETEQFKDSPYDKAWIVKVKIESSDFEKLMSAEDYQKFTEES